jgi:hypothetical protein
VRRVAPFLSFVIALAIPATGLYAQKQSSVPPRDLHRVGEHWTAYNPPDPATYPAGSKTHEIKSGDTLWELADQYYGNAYLWPQLWESNTWITDAHWIYPGDVLLVTGEAGDAAAATTTGASGELTEGALSAVSPRDDTLSGEFGGSAVDSGAVAARMTLDNRPLPLATEFDIYCYGYIGHPQEPMPNYIQSHEAVDVKYVPRQKDGDRNAGDAADGDLVYVAGGAETGLTAGETYMIVVPGELVNHPSTGELVGRHYNYAGQLRILCIEGNRSRAVVTQACREIPIGAKLKPLPQLPIPIARIPNMPQWCDAPSGRTNGFIVDTQSWDLGISTGNLVQVDLGSNDALEPGDFLTVYRPSPRADQPRQVLGQLGILTTQADTATAVVVTSRLEMHVGDQVEMR